MDKRLDEALRSPVAVLHHNEHDVYSKEAGHHEEDIDSEGSSLEEGELPREHQVGDKGGVDQGPVHLEVKGMSPNDPAH